MALNLNSNRVDLVFYLEVAGLRVVEHQSRYARRRVHHARLRKRYAREAFRIEQVEQYPFCRMVRTRGGSRMPDVCRGNRRVEASRRRKVRRGVTPLMRAHLVVQPFGERFRQTVAQQPRYHGAIVVALGFYPAIISSAPNPAERAKRPTYPSGDTKSAKERQKPSLPGLF